MAVPLTKRVESLRKTSLFEAVDDRSLRQIAKALSEFEARPGQVLVEARAPGSGMFIVTDGEVRVEARRERIELGPGTVIGELALLNADQVRTARVRAVTDVSGYALSRRDFTRLVESHPKLALALLRVLAQRLTDQMV